VLLPNWVDLNEIRPQTQSERKNNIYRRGLGLKQEDVVLLYSGSMNKKQGLDVVIESIKGLQDHREIIWILAGEGPEKASLEEITRGLAQVRIMPLQPAEHLNEWLNLADIHILPQRGAAADLVLPSKLLGILASGKPVVATSPAGSTLRSIAEEAGICVNPGDARAFAEAIKNLATDEKRRLELGMNARLIAEKEFDKEAVLEYFESYLNLL
jgi:colanic acid biosynthesis glycosyl transferase WcaI